MKAKNLFFGALTCLAFAACSDDNDLMNSGGQAEAEKGTSFLAVSITMPGGTSTRAEGDPWGSEDDESDNTYKEGENEEVTVNTAHLFFFDSNGNWWGVKNITNDIKGQSFGSGDDATNVPTDNRWQQGTTNTIDNLSQVFIMFENQQVPDQVVAVLNLTEEQVTALSDKSLDNFRKALTATSVQAAEDATAAATTSPWAATGFSTSSNQNPQGFIMSNSVYQASTESTESTDNESSTTPEIVYAQKTKDHIISSDNTTYKDYTIEQIRDAAKQNQLVIPVERVLARVHVEFGKESSIDNSNLVYTYTGQLYTWDATNNKIVDNSATSIISVPNGWWLDCTPAHSYLMKDLESNDVNNSWTTWNDLADKRSYWAMPYSSTDDEANPKQKYQHYAYERNNMADKYCFENTIQRATGEAEANTQNNIKLIVAANLFVDATVLAGETETQAVDETGSTAITYSKIDLVRWKKSHYTKTAFLQYVANFLTSKGKSVTSSELRIVSNFQHTDDSDDPTYKPTSESSCIELQDWEAIVEYSGTTSTTEVQDLLDQQIGAFQYFGGGKTYYFTHIEHNKVNNTPIDGVIRNHYYKITVNGITGLGTPVPEDDPETPENPKTDPTDPDPDPETPTIPEIPDDPDPTDPEDPIIPDLPEDDNVSAIATQISILKYRIVSQETTLSGGAQGGSNSGSTENGGETN